MSKPSPFIVIALMLWIQQISCVIGGTLEWHVLFYVPGTFVIGVAGVALYWRLRQWRQRRDIERDFPNARSVQR